MKKMRMSLLSLMALALLVGPSIVQAAVRFNVAVRTPNVSIRVGSIPSDHYLIRRLGHLPVRRLHRHKIRMRDRKIAQRLARYTGVPVRVLIRLRRCGYAWFEIGRWLRLPHRVVRAAMHRRSWKRFLLDERRLARCGEYPYGRYRVVCPDDYYDDD